MRSRGAIMLFPSAPVNAPATNSFAPEGSGASARASGPRSSGRMRAGLGDRFVQYTGNLKYQYISALRYISQDAPLGQSGEPRNDAVARLEVSKSRAKRC